MAARDELGVTPPAARDTLVRTARWLIAQGHLPAGAIRAEAC